MGSGRQILESDAASKRLHAWVVAAAYLSSCDKDNSVTRIK